MHPELIKAAIRMTGTTPARIADELACSDVLVSQVIHGRTTSARVRRHIANVIGKSVVEIWPPAGGPVLRRTKATALSHLRSRVVA